jgi:ABC-type sulfate transport system permease component
MSTFLHKTEISMIVSLIFVLVSLPETYKLTNKYIMPNILFDQMTNCPTALGQLIHTAVFAFIVFFQMFIKTLSGYSVNGNKSTQDAQKSFGIKIKHTLYASLIFFFISSPTLYKLTNEFISNKISSLDGCPTNFGIGLHSIVYCIFLISVMYLP